MSTPTFELDRSPQAFIATLEVDSPMMQAQKRRWLSLVSAVVERLGNNASTELTGGIELNSCSPTTPPTYTERASQEDCCGSQTRRK